MKFLFAYPTVTLLSLLVVPSLVPVLVKANDLILFFTNTAEEAGLKARIIYGGEKTNKYLLETTGCGVALFDYDNDGWLDIFLVNGSRLEGFEGPAPHSHLYRNNHDGTFSDVTESSGTAYAGWGQAVCAGDYNNDGWEDLFVTYWGDNLLLRNNGDGTFTNVAKEAGLSQREKRWNTGCAFLDYDRDGDLDLFVANYIDFDLDTTPTPDSGLCLYKGVKVACGPPGLRGGKNILYKNNGDGSFTDVSDESGITQAYGTYGLGVLTADFDNDGWIDIYVANDSSPSTLYRNNKNGAFTDMGILAGCAYSQDGKPQAGMGVSSGDYDHDGWLDIFQVNGHVYPEVNQLKTEAQYKQRKVVYLSDQSGKFIDLTEQLGPAVSVPKAGRGSAFGDLDNDGDVDVVVNNVNETPDLFRLDSKTGNSWVSIRLIGKKSNRSAIGARVNCATGNLVQIDEVRSGGSYFSQNDLRVHFGLGRAEKIDWLEISWPSGEVDRLANLEVNRFHTIREGEQRRD